MAARAGAAGATRPDRGGAAEGLTSGTGPRPGPARAHGTPRIPIAAAGLATAAAELITAEAGPITDAAARTTAPLMAAATAPLTVPLTAAAPTASGVRGRTAEPAMEAAARTA